MNDVVVVRPNEEIVVIQAPPVDTVVVAGPDVTRIEVSVGNSVVILVAV